MEPKTILKPEFVVRPDAAPEAIVLPADPAIALSTPPTGSEDQVVNVRLKAELLYCASKILSELHHLIDMLSEL